MLPNSWVLVAYLSIFVTLAGAVMGALSGAFACLALQTGKQRLNLNSLIGASGFLLGFLACVFIPVGRNTVYSILPGGGSQTITMNTYQHPFVVAFVAAAFFPVIHEIYRWKRKKARSTMDRTPS